MNWIQPVALIPGRLSYRVLQDLVVDGNCRASRGELLTREGAEFIFAAGPVFIDPHYGLAVDPDFAAACGPMDDDTALAAYRDFLPWLYECEDGAGEAFEAWFAARYELFGLVP